MKVFFSSTYNDLIEYRKAAHDKNHLRMNPRMHEYQTPIREFVKNSWTVFYGIIRPYAPCS